MKFPTAVIDEVLKAKSEYASDDFIVGYRLSPEEAESPGISMEITEQLINTITEKSIDYVHISLGGYYKPYNNGFHGVLGP